MASPSPQAPGSMPGGTPDHGRRARAPRRGAGGRRALVAVGVVATVGVAAGVAVTAGVFDATASSCADGRRVLTVAAAPEIAAAVAATAAGQDDDACTDVRVSAAAPADVAEERAGADGDDALPDVWIPDSSLWLVDGAVGTDESAGSIARSPLVLAVRAPAGSGEPAAPPDLAAALGDGSRRLLLADPARSAGTRLGLLALQRALAPLADGQERLGALYRSAESTADAVDPAATLAAVLGAVPLGVFVPEQAVWSANAGPAGPTAVAVYPPEPTVLDYPYVVLAEHPDARADGARLRAALLGPRGRAALAGAGFRTPDGTAAATAAPPGGVHPEQATDASVPVREDVDGAVSAFRTVTLGTRLLAVVDVSGSMVLTLPGEPPRRRIELAVGAATSGLALYPDDAQVGLWVFATDLTTTTDHRELVPIGTLGTRPDGVTGRERMAAGLAGVAVVPDGDTGLHDTVLAAVRSVREGWDPRRVNSVVLFTDGHDDDADGVALPTLLGLLEEEGRDRPVAVIGIGLGPDADLGALRQIAAVTHGAAYEVHDARMMRDVVADALASRPCRPGC